MRGMSCLAAFAVVFLALGRGAAQQPCPRGGPFTWCAGCERVLTCCPNDYHAKPQPLVAAPHWCGPNDYERKPFPPFPCPAPRGCNDYERKPCPVCTPLNRAGWQCGPPACHP